MRDHAILIDELASGADPVRPQSTRSGRLALAAVAAATIAAVSMVYGLRSDVVGGHPPPLLGITAGLMLVLAAAAGASAVRMARPQVGAASSGAPWALAGLLVLPAVALAGIAAQPDRAAGLALEAGLRCLLVGLVAGAGTLAFLTLWLRRGAPVSPGRAAWLAGLAAGGIGALAVTLECPEDAFAHIGIWHVAVPLVAAMLARLVLPRVLRW